MLITFVCLLIAPPEPTAVVVKIDANAAATYTIQIDGQKVKNNQPAMFIANSVREVTVTITYVNKDEVITDTFKVKVKPGDIKRLEFRLRAYPTLARI